MIEETKNSALGERILAALAAAGRDPAGLVAADLYPIDQMHPRGAAAVRDLAALVGLKAGESVLDIGCGIGGPARLLAAEFGARVSAFDLDPSAVAAAEYLTARVGLGSRLAFSAANALDMPFAGAAFDLAWVQQSAMTIADKARLYAGIRRVLKPGGRLALGDCLAGPGGAAHFPLPWSPDGRFSFLLEAADLKEQLRAAGFRELAWNDATAAAIVFFRNMIERLAKEAVSPPGAQLVMGPRFAEMVANLLRSLEQDRVRLVEAAFAAV
jgi:SAM-dependent methyltransferase